MRIAGISKDYSNIHSQSRNKPNFCGYVSVFSKRLDKVLKQNDCSIDDSMYLYNKLQKIIDKRKRQNDVLGEGTLAKVFKIDSKYVLRSGKLGSPVVESFRRGDIDNRAYFGLKTYYGDYVAKFGDIQILRNVSSTGKHIPAGVPSKITLSKSPEESRKYYEETYLPLFAKLSQKAYDDVAYDFSTLNMYCTDGFYRFDVLNPNNFVLVGKKICIVDNLVKKNEESQFLLAYNETKQGGLMSIADLMRAFLMLQEAGVECEFSEKALPLRRELFKKIVLAGVKNNLPVVNEENMFCFEKVAEILCKSNCDAVQIQVNLERLVDDYCDNPKKTLRKVADYVDSIFKPCAIDVF